jgi:hypothetical protein
MPTPDRVQPAAVAPGASRLHLIDYDDQHLTERDVTSVEECAPFREASSVTWLNVDGRWRWG